MQQRSSIIPTGNWEKGTGWTNVFIITLQRIDQISDMSLYEASVLTIMTDYPLFS